MINIEKEKKEILKTDEVISIFKKTWEEYLDGKITNKDKVEHLEKILARFENENPNESKKLNNLDEDGVNPLFKLAKKIQSGHKQK